RGSRFAVTLQFAAASGLPPDARWRGRRLLVCDEDPLTRDHLAQLLEVTGATVDVAAAPPTVSDHDLVVVGLMHPTPDVLRSLAERVSGRPTMVLLDTHDDAEFDRVRATVDGACHPRCMSVSGFHRAVAIALGEALPAEAASGGDALAGLAMLVVDD